VAGILYKIEKGQFPAHCEPHPDAKRKGVAGLQSTIIVGERFFDPKYVQIENDDDALSILRDHEGRHAKDNFTVRISESRPTS